MNKTEKKIKKVFKEHGGFARTRDIITAGIHSRDIKRIKDEGKIIRVKRGLYRLSEIPLISNQGFIDLARSVPDGVICLLSALSFYELTTFNPSVISMALCRGRRRPKIEHPPAEFYYFSTKQFKAGIDKVNIKNHNIKIYSPEKTICDCFRYRSKLGIDTVKEALSNYLKRKDRDLESLLKYAEICRVKSIMDIWIKAMV